MAPKYTCPCFRCHSSRDLTRKTIFAHFKLNQQHLDHLLSSEANQDTVDFVQGCSKKMMELMNSLTGVSSSEQSRSPYLGGEHLIPYDFNYC
jgi:hypothetical protein